MISNRIKKQSTKRKYTHTQKLPGEAYDVVRHAEVGRGQVDEQRFGVDVEDAVAIRAGVDARLATYPYQDRIDVEAMVYIGWKLVPFLLRG